jgi:hypothetical protein
VAATYRVSTTDQYLEFNGTNTRYNIDGSFIANQYYTVFAVERLQAAPSPFTRPLIGGTTLGTNANLHLQYINSSANTFRFSQYDDTGAFIDSPVPAFTTAAAQPTRLFTFSQQTSNRSLILNGSNISTTLNNTLISAWAGASIGFYGPNSEYYQGHMKDILFYTGLMTPFDRQKVEGYLAWKWGLQTSLPASHPFRTAVPLTTSVFSPSSFAGLALWLDGADPIATGTAPANGSTIVTWVDKSGAGNNAGAVGTTPTFLAASNAISFGGAGYYSTNYSAALSNESLFVVLRVAGANQFQNLLAAPSNAARGFLVDTANRYLISISRNVAVGSIGPTNSITANSIFIAQLMVASGAHTTFVNGGNQGTTVGVSYTAGIPSLICAGDGGPPTSLFTGNIHEILGFSTILSAADRQTVEGYLAWKWGLQANLPATHPYRNTSPSQRTPVYEGLFLYVDSETFTGTTSSVRNQAAIPGTNTMSTNLITLSSISYNSTKVSSFYFNATSNQYVAAAFNMSNSFNSTMGYRETREIWVYYTGVTGSLLSEHGGYPPAYDFAPTNQFRNTQLTLLNSSIVVSYIQPDYVTVASNVVFSTLQYNRWYQIVTQFTQATTPTQVVFVNGQQVFSNSGLPARSGPDTHANAAYHISLGSATGTAPTGGTTYFTGAVAVYRHYSTLLTSSQVLYNYNYEKARFGLT